MNILNKFKISLYDEKEYRKLDKLITVKKHIQGYYFFYNPYDFSNDLAYAELLGIDIHSYRQLVFYNCLVTSNDSRTGTFFIEYREAMRGKKILLTLLLTRYRTTNEIVKAITNILNK